MRFSSPVAALTLLSALGWVAASDVLDLTAKSFTTEVMGEDLALVEFFAPCKWSSHTLYGYHN
jgi:protein disulfide-isomerase A1